MRAIIFVLLAAAVAAAPEKRLPGEAPLTSPRGSFRIIQRSDNDVWHTTLHFTKAGLPSVVFADDYRWPARFFASPDDQWLLQIQKSGSGDNIAFLYRIEPSGRIWRTEAPLSAAAFKYLEQSENLSTAHLYHAGLDFIGWDFPAGLLRFSIHASASQYGQSGVNRILIYDLKKHTFRSPKP